MLRFAVILNHSHFSPFHTLSSICHRSGSRSLVLWFQILVAVVILLFSYSERIHKLELEIESLSEDGGGDSRHNEELTKFAPSFMNLMIILLIDYINFTNDRITHRTRG